MNRYVFGLMICMLISCNKTYYEEPEFAPAYFNKNLQLIEVRTGNMTAINGVMFLYDRKSTEDKFVLKDSFPVVVGRNGMAWDNKSPIKYGAQRIKHEGDGCSPMGIFSLVLIFSYHEMNNLKMPFELVDSTDICVDDVNSIYYNQLIDTDTSSMKNYNSFEYMKRHDDLYEYGVWVNYNSDPAVPGSGSCIFLHVWKDKNTPTSGCTAMSKENIIKLIDWLDAKKNPLLFQYAEM